MWFGIVSLFPEMFGALQTGITGRALKTQRIQIEHANLRDFATDKHKSVDDRPFGGGPGMVMMAEPLSSSIQHLRTKAPSKPKVIYLSPQGKRFDQTAAAAFSQEPALLLICGRYEGIDERVIEQEVDEEWSIGDYILTGGELPAMILIDATTRLLEGTLGDAASVEQDSLTTGLLKYPQYTRPLHLGEQIVPPILLSGHHEAISDWRLKASLGKTWLRRPDLIDKKMLSQHERRLLDEFIKEFSQSTLEK